MGAALAGAGAIADGFQPIQRPAFPLLSCRVTSSHREAQGDDKVCAVVGGRIAIPSGLEPVQGALAGRGLDLGRLVTLVGSCSPGLGLSIPLLRGAVAKLRAGVPVDCAGKKLVDVDVLRQTCGVPFIGAGLSGIRVPIAVISDDVAFIGGRVAAVSGVHLFVHRNLRFHRAPHRAVRILIKTLPAGRVLADRERRSQTRVCLVGAGPAS